MESLKSSIMDNRDEAAARQTAHQIISLLDGFIPGRCREEALYWIMEASYKEGFELTSKLMRKEYEAWKDLQLKGLEPYSPWVKPE